MTTRNLSIRLAVVDGQKVKAEFRDVAETGQRALKKIEDAATPAARALKVLDGAAGEMRGTMESMTGRLGPLGGALSALGPAGLAAGAALAAASAGMIAGVQEAALAERSYRRLEAVLNATGHASGLTGQQITAAAEEIERSTLASAEAVQDAAAVLATFRSVSGETFTRTLSLAQDMAAVFGQDLSSAALQLGKALQDPEQGLTALRRVGISFTQSQRDLIQSLMETGQQAEAQRLILNELERQVGGAGAAEAGGLTGATNRLSDAWGNFLETLGQTPSIAGFVEGALNTISNAIETVSGMIAGARVAVIEGRLTPAPTDDYEAQIAEAQRRVAESEARMAKPGAIGIRGAALRSQLETQRQELALLQRQRDEAMATRQAAEEKARAGQQAAEAEARTERLAGLRAEIEKALVQHATAAEKRETIDKAYADKRRQIEALRTAENAAEIDATLAREAELHRRQIAALDATEAKRGAVGAKRAASAEKSAARDIARNAEVVEQLQRQMQTAGDPRQQFVDQALQRLSASATAAQRAEVEKLAGALYEQREAQRAADIAKRDGIRLTTQLLTPSEEYAETLARINQLLAAQAITEQTAARARKEAADAFAHGQKRMLAESSEWNDGVTLAFLELSEEAGTLASVAEYGITEAFEAAADAITQFVTTGKIDFQSFADSIVADITRIMVKQMLLNAVMSAFGSSMGMPAGGTAAQAAGTVAAGAMASGMMMGAAPGAGPATAVAAPIAGAAAGTAAAAASGGWLSSIGSWLASWFHEGGIVGQGAPPTRMLDASVFLGAPRYHTGGLAGAYASGALKPDEIPAILQRGEMVLSRSQVAKQTGAGRAASPINVVMNITTPDTNGFRQSQGQIAADAARTIARAQRRFL